MPLHPPIQVVSYEGEHLMQRFHDDTVITLLQTSIPDSTHTTYIRSRPTTEVPREKQKGQSFGDNGSQGTDFPMVSKLILIRSSRLAISV